MIRALFLFIYLTVDIIYVTFSRPVYEQVARNIQGKGFPSFTATRALAAFMAYFSMAIGWWFLVAPIVALSVTQNKNSLWKSIAYGAFFGFIFGLLVYGVFNGTLHVMFEKYDTKILIRDLLWGVGWSTILTSMFAWTMYHFQSKPAFLSSE